MLRVKVAPTVSWHRLTIAQHPCHLFEPQFKKTSTGLPTTFVSFLIGLYSLLDEFGTSSWHTFVKRGATAAVNGSADRCIMFAISFTASGS